MYLATTSLVCLMLVGCGPPSAADNQVRADRALGGAVATFASATPAPVRQAATADQWAQAVEQVFDKVNVKRLRDKKNPAYVEDQGKPDQNGVIEYFACFDKAPPKCELPSSGRRDGFKKIQFFADPAMEFSDLAAKYTPATGKPSVRAYITLRDCHPPSIVLNPAFRAANWMFVEQFGVMVDDHIVIDRKFDSSQVERDNSPREISESMHVVLNAQEVDALREVVRGRQVVIRLTGKKGYVGVDQAGTREFVQGVARLLRIHDALGQAIKGLGSVIDVACPV